MKDIRRTLAKFPQEAAEHLLNGMFYEMYFDSKGVFRGSKLKSARMSDLFSIQTVDKYENSIYFISQALEPYRSGLVLIPCNNAPTISVEVTIDMKDPPVVTSLQFLGRELLVDIEQAKFDTNGPGDFLSFSSISRH